MKPTIITHKHYLLVLSDPDLDISVKKYLMKKGPEPVITLITNLCWNILKKNIPIPEECVNKLKKHKVIVSLLAAPIHTFDQKQKFIGRNFDEIYSTLALLYFVFQNRCHKLNSKHKKCITHFTYNFTFTTYTKLCKIQELLSQEWEFFQVLFYQKT